MVEKKMASLAVFVSGSGTNLENLAVKIEKKELTNCQIVLVVCDQPGALALKRATTHHLKTILVKRSDFKTKSEFEQAIIRTLKERRIDYIVLAGFMRVLSPNFVQMFKGKIVNIHPALLPKFPGAHALQEAWDAKVKSTGVTVHFVDEGIDTGPVILQKKIGISHFETLEALEKRIHETEYKLYPRAIQWLVDGCLEVVGKKVYCDGKELTALVQ